MFTFDWRLPISINLISSTEENNDPNHEKVHVKVSDTARPVGLKHVEWQTFVKLKLKRQMQ